MKKAITQISKLKFPVATIATSGLLMLGVSTTALAHGYSGNYPDNSSPTGPFKLASFTNNSNKSHLRHGPLTCDQEQSVLNAQASATLRSDTKDLKKLNIIYVGVQNYVSTNNLNVPHYTTSNIKVAGDQTKATTDVNNISAPQLDCTSSSLPSSSNQAAVNAFEHSISSTKQALANYSHNLFKLFNAVLNS